MGIALCKSTQKLNSNQIWRIQKTKSAKIYEMKENNLQSISYKFSNNLKKMQDFINWLQLI
jgi:hypothetical protein